MSSSTTKNSIQLTTQQDVKDFCYEMSTLPKCIDIKAISKGGYTVDARSILGMFSLDLSNPVDIIFESTESFDTNKITESLTRWAV